MGLWRAPHLPLFRITCLKQPHPHYGRVILTNDPGYALTTGRCADVGKIHVGGTHLLGIISDILDLSKIEAGRMELHVETFTVKGMLDDVVATAQRLMAQNGNAFEIRAAPDLDDMTADLTKVRQILFNLLSNAAKFTEHGTVTLAVSRTTHGEDSAPCFEFSVRDSGIGMSPDQKDRLFQTFYQGDSSTTRKYGGTGLGLAISKLLAELMGGTMWAESAGPGQGSAFHFTIRNTPTTLPVGTRREFLGEQPALKGKRILVVDDNATNRRILALQTARWGMVVQDTEFPAQAEPLLRQQPFDLAIIDMHMPGMDGAMLARAIRAASSRPALERGQPAFELGEASPGGEREVVEHREHPARVQRLRVASLRMLGSRSAPISTSCPFRWVLLGRGVEKTAL